MKRFAFTLTELLVGVSILSVLSGLAVLGLRSVREHALKETVRLDMVKITAVCRDYKRQNGHFPVPVLSASGYSVLRSGKVWVDVPYNADGDYVDPWGKPYFYYPYPVGDRPYSDEEEWWLAYPVLSGGSWAEFQLYQPRQINRMRAERWQEKTSLTRNVEILIVSGGPDGHLVWPQADSCMTWELMNDDDLFNYNLLR